jgi:hypothetical protein
VIPVNIGYPARMMLPIAMLAAAVVGPVDIQDNAATRAFDHRLSLRQPTPEDLEAAAPAQPFGTKGQEHWMVASGAAFDLEVDDQTTDVPLTLGYSKFLVDNVELSLELSAWGHFQEGDDAASLNPGFNVRWHFVNRDRWTLFTEVGIGLLFSTDDVPDGGTSFNFTPRAGAGATWRLTDSGVRLIGAARWHHVSNARITGESANPDRDGILFYAGVMFPF